MSPLIIFVYNRPWHTEQTINSILRNEEVKNTNLIIFSDGCKKNSDQENVDKVRSYIKKIRYFKNIEIIERDHNFGLSKSIIDGVTKVIKQYRKAIVLEDDMVVSCYFLKFMNEALDYYQNDERVGCIHAWNFPIKEKLPDTFFLRGADCWGWATWERAWNLFERDGSKLLLELEKFKLNYEFDLDGSYDYIQMLNDQVNGKVDSWAIRWNASLFLKNMLTLYPGKSLLKNIGFDNSGVHSTFDSRLYSEVNDNSKLSFPRKVEVNLKVRKLIINHLKNDNKSGFWNSLNLKLIKKIKLNDR